MKPSRFAFASMLLAAGLTTLPASAAVIETLTLESQTAPAKPQAVQIEEILLGAPGADGKIGYTALAQRNRGVKYSILRVRVKPGSAAEQLAADGKAHRVFSRAKIQIVQANGAQEQTLYALDLENAKVTSFESATIEGKAVSYATITYSKITIVTGTTGGSSGGQDTWDTAQTHAG